MISDSVKFAEETVSFEAAAEPLDGAGAAVGSEHPLRTNEPATTERAARRGSLLLFIMVSLNSSREMLLEDLSRSRPEGASHLSIVAYYAGHTQYLMSPTGHSDPLDETPPPPAPLKRPRTNASPLRDQRGPKPCCTSPHTLTVQRMKRAPAHPGPHAAIRCEPLAMMDPRLGQATADAGPIGKAP